jgi:glycosyltransferase involved in cell wall biosynthesis
VVVTKNRADVSHITICHVISGDLWGGAEAQAAALIGGLADRTRVCVIVFNRGELCLRLEASNVAVDVADETALGFMGLIRRVHAILGKRRPSLVHVHGFKENLVAGMAARLRGIPIVRTHHGRGMVGVSLSHTCIERFNARFLTDRLIAVSKDLAAFLRSRGLSMRKLRVILNGISLQTAQAEGEIDNRAPVQRPFTIGTVGRLVGVKNHRCLLDAFRRFRDKFGMGRLILIGDGPLASQLQLLAAEMGISNDVVFTGFQRDVGEHLRRLDLFVLSSLHEGVPISLLEAMTMGIPVISTRVGGIPEVLTDNHNGLLVESDDAEALSAAMIKVATDPKLGQRLAENARSAVANEFSFERCLSNTISLYSETVSQ